MSSALDLTGFIAEHVRQIPRSGIREFFDIVQAQADVISLGVGEPDFVTPWHIREAAIYALEQGRTSYTSNLGLLKLRQAISAHLEIHFGLSFDPHTQVPVSYTHLDVYKRQGHTAAVVSVAWSADGQRVVSAGDDQTARVWDAIGHHELIAVTKHGSPISSVAFSPDGQRILTGGGTVLFSPEGTEQFHAGDGDRTTKLWDISNDREWLTLRGHKDRVMTVAFSPDGRRLVTGSLDQAAKIWDAYTGRELATLEDHHGGIRSVAFPPEWDAHSDGRLGRGN